MKRKLKEKELSSIFLKNLQKELSKVEKAENYLEKEKKKLMDSKEKIRIKIKKEKEVLELKQKIERIKRRKK